VDSKKALLARTRSVGLLTIVSEPKFDECTSQHFVGLRQRAQELGWE
jgi:hypothetical protein